MNTGVGVSPWERLLERPYSRGHFVQLYKTGEASLANNAGLYFSEGLKRGDGVLIIATPEHWKLFCGRLTELGADPQSLVRNHQLVFFDAQQTLARFMAGGQPDWELFEAAIGAAMRQVRRAKDDAGLRAYGEMVGILWQARQFAASLRLEQLWNKLLEQSSFSLYCAYAIDVFGQEFPAAALDGVLGAHTHLIPAQTDGNLEAALNAAMDEILGPEADSLRQRIRANYHPSWAVMANAEASVLWLKKNLPGQVGEILGRARRLLQPGEPVLDVAS